jgi:hypothetical protein
MRIKEVRIGKAVTVNLGNYESARAEVLMVADINEDDSLENEMSELSEIVRKQLAHETRKIMKKES